MTPARRNEIQTAAPATSPAAPSSEKMPAPTIAPTPMNAACDVDTYRRGDEGGASACSTVATGTAASAIVLTLRGRRRAALASADSTPRPRSQVAAAAQGGHHPEGMTSCPASAVVPVAALTS